MEISDLIAMLTDGATPEQSAAVKALVEREATKTRVAALKQASEYEALAARETALKVELDGTTDRPGSRAYREWYDKNYPNIQKLQTDMAAYQQKYGTLEAPVNPAPPNPANSAYVTREEAMRMAQDAADQRIREQYAPRWSELLTSTGSLVQRHMFAGRKTPIDFTAVSALAKDKYNGNLGQAYDEWDKPERDKEAKLSEDKRVEARVQEELQKRRVQATMPGGVDMGRSTLTPVPKADLDKYDREGLKRDLAHTFMTGEYSPKEVV